MKSYAEFPPIDNFKKVLAAHPKSALVYAQVYSLKTKTLLSVRKTTIARKFAVSSTIFKNLLMSICAFEFIKLEENSTHFIIEFPDSDNKFSE